MNDPVEKIPLLIGLKAARANLIPGLIVQSVMLALVLVYYWHEPARRWLDVLAQWKAAGGYWFSIGVSMLAGGVLPELLKVLVLQRGLARLENLQSLVFGCLFWGAMGACVDTLYRLQSLWFGNTPTIAVLAKKVAIDQFAWNPLWAAPISVWMYEWKNQGFSSRGLSRFVTARHYRLKVFPVLIANWGVWIPVVTLIYSLPPLLQIPLFGVALSFWALMIAYMTSAKPQPGSDAL
jgi:hypothetical protein